MLWGLAQRKCSFEPFLEEMQPVIQLNPWSAPLFTAKIDQKSADMGHVWSKWPLLTETLCYPSYLYVIIYQHREQLELQQWLRNYIYIDTSKPWSHSYTGQKPAETFQDFEHIGEVLNGQVKMTAGVAGIYQLWIRSTLMGTQLQGAHINFP